MKTTKNLVGKIFDIFSVFTFFHGRAFICIKFVKSKHVVGHFYCEGPNERVLQLRKERERERVEYLERKISNHQKSLFWMIAANNFLFQKNSKFFSPQFFLKKFFFVNVNGLERTSSM